MVWHNWLNMFSFPRVHFSLSWSILVSYTLSPCPVLVHSRKLVLWFCFCSYSVACLVLLEFVNTRQGWYSILADYGMLYHLILHLTDALIFNLSAFGYICFFLFYVLLYRAMYGPKLLSIFATSCTRFIIISLDKVVICCRLLVCELIWFGRDICS